MPPSAVKQVRAHTYTYTYTKSVFVDLAWEIVCLWHHCAELACVYFYSVDDRTQAFEHSRQEICTESQFHLLL